MRTRAGLTLLLAAAAVAFAPLPRAGFAEELSTIAERTPQSPGQQAEPNAVTPPELTEGLSGSSLPPRHDPILDRWSRTTGNIPPGAGFDPGLNPVGGAPARLDEQRPRREAPPN